MKKRILLIDDEISVRNFLRHSLESNNYLVVEAASASEAWQKYIELKPDLLILDFGLPDESGLQVLKKIREVSAVPILFLTVHDSEVDKVAALDAGADDYLTKPFSVAELLARLRVAMRHHAVDASLAIFKSGSLEINRESHLVRVAGREIKLTSTEYNILDLLAKNAGKVVSHRKLLMQIWGPNSVEHNHYLRVYLAQIRKKLDTAEQGTGDLIETESGVGYRLAWDSTIQKI